MSKITIVLSESDHAKEFSEQNLIYQEEFKKMVKHIEEALEIVNKDPHQRHLHNTITVSGTRGSGKTSFLLSVNNRIKDRKEGDEVVPKALQENIEVLRIIDPTLIEQKEHVFLNVIAVIKKLVEDKLDKHECDPVYSNKDQYLRKDWESSLFKLAAGLPTIDGVGSKNMVDWQDPEFIMQKGLISVSSALNLESNFSRMLEQALRILNKKTFLLSFDDIDVDPGKGWDVLECIRKYFTTPRLITIISGDMNLYTTLVREKKWKTFGVQMLQHEGHNLSRFSAMVTELTSQYLLKVLQPKNRIGLETILEQKNKNGKLNVLVAFMHKSGAKTEPIEKMYASFLEKHGIKNYMQQEVYKNFFYTQPLRTQIHLLTEIITESSSDVNIISVFQTDMLEKNINVSQVTTNPKFLNINILNLLLHDELLKDNYQLQPVTTDNSLNASLLSLSILESHFIQHGNLYLIFDYMVRVAYIRNLMSVIQQDVKDIKNPKNPLSHNPSIEDLCRKTGLMQEGVLRDIMGHIQSYLYGYHQLVSKKDHHTTSYLRLTGLEEKAHRRTKSLDGIFDRENVTGSQKILGQIPGFSATFNYKNDSRVAYSVYLLLASIGELLKVYETSLKYNPGSEEDGIRTTLSELSQLRSYPVFEFSSTSSDDGEEEVQGEDSGGSEIKDKTLSDADDLYNKVSEWMQKSKSKIVVSPHVLGKMSTRFFYAMINMMGRKPKDDLGLGDIFHYQIIAFMNSVLIEDMRENVKDISFLNINNTNYANKIFIDNLSNEKTKKIGKDDLLFSRWLLTCPLLTAYLNFDDVLKNALKEYCDVFVENEEFNISVHDLLNQVALNVPKKRITKAASKPSDKKNSDNVPSNDKPSDDN